MTENVEINISSNIDTKGLDQLRKALNDQRNELNAVARETDKADIKYKQLKATVTELNRIMKLSDTELKQYASSLIPVEKNIDRVTNAKGRMTTASDKLSRSFSSLKTNVGSYSTTIVNLSSDIAQGDKSIMQSVGALGLYAGGWAAVASAVYLATQNIVEYLNKDSLVIKNLESNMPKTGDILGGTDGSLSYYDRKRTGLFFDNNIGPQYDKSQTPYGPTRESMPGPFDAERLANIYGRNNVVSKGSLGKVAKVIVEKTQQELYIEMLKRANEIKNSRSQRIDERKLTLLQQMNLPGENYSTAIRQEPGIDPSRNTLEDIQTGYSLIGQSMTLLNIGTDTFVGKLMAVFDFANSALSIGSSIIKFVTSIIPGVPDSMVNSNTSIDTNRLINQNISMSSSPVNIYMSSNVSQKYFKAQIENYNSMKQYTKI